jgi:hypothetical protein
MGFAKLKNQLIIGYSNENGLGGGQEAGQGATWSLAQSLHGLALCKFDANFLLFFGTAIAYIFFFLTWHNYCIFIFFGTLFAYISFWHIPCI